MTDLQPTDIKTMIESRYNSVKITMGVLLGIEIAILMQAALYYGNAGLTNKDAELYTVGLLIGIVSISGLLVRYCCEISNTSSLYSPYFIKNSERFAQYPKTLEDRYVVLESICIRNEVILTTNLASLTVFLALIIGVLTNYYLGAMILIFGILPIKWILILHNNEKAFDKELNRHGFKK